MLSRFTFPTDAFPFTFRSLCPSTDLSPCISVALPKLMQVVVQPISTAASERAAAAAALWQHMGSQIQSSRRVYDAEAPDR